MLPGLGGGERSQRSRSRGAGGLLGVARTGWKAPSAGRVGWGPAEARSFHPAGGRRGGTLGAARGFGGGLRVGPLGRGCARARAAPCARGTLALRPGRRGFRGGDEEPLAGVSARLPSRNPGVPRGPGPGARRGSCSRWLEGPCGTRGAARSGVMEFGSSLSLPGPGAGGRGEGERRSGGLQLVGLPERPAPGAGGRQRRARAERSPNGAWGVEQLAWYEDVLLCVLWGALVGYRWPRARAGEGPVFQLSRPVVAQGGFSRLQEVLGPLWATGWGGSAP